MAERPDHYIAKCKHGTVTGQCRCRYKDKTEVLSECLSSCPKPTAEHEIDEAAAVRLFEWAATASDFDPETNMVNAARAALAWKARAEAAEAERDRLQDKCYALESHAHGLENRATAAERLADRLLDEARKGGWK